MPFQHQPVSREGPGFTEGLPLGPGFSQTPGQCVSPSPASQGPSQGCQDSVNTNAETGREGYHDDCARHHY